MREWAVRDVKIEVKVGGVPAVKWWLGGSGAVSRFVSTYYLKGRKE